MNLHNSTQTYSVYLWQAILLQGLNLSTSRFQAEINEVILQVPDSDKFCILIHGDIIAHRRDNPSNVLSHFKDLLAIFKQMV